jgi:hypothetical protein
MVCGRVGVVDPMLFSEERKSPGSINIMPSGAQLVSLINCRSEHQRASIESRVPVASILRLPKESLHLDVSPWIRLCSRKICALSQLRLWLLWWWECGYDWSRMLQHKRMVVSIEQRGLYLQAKTSCNISPHLDGSSNK